MLRLLPLLVFLPWPLVAQFTYSLDQTVPVEVDEVLLKNGWAGGLNSPQVNTMDLNADGAADLVIFDKSTAKISTFLWVTDSYLYAPEYEILFPTELSTFVQLRDFNCDGKKDIFTFGQIGIFVFKQVAVTGKPFGWEKQSFINLDTDQFSDVVLTLPPPGPTGFINILPGTNDLPDFTDMDGDGDLDILNMRFVNPSTAEFHKNYSMEQYGVCSMDSIVRQTSNWGGFLECSCNKVAFQGQTCADIGGRIDHTGGKALLTLDTDNDGDRDLLFSEESCTSIYLMENIGTTAAPIMQNLSIFPSGSAVAILSYPTPYLEDVDHDGVPDLLASPNLSVRNSAFNNFESSLWFYKNTGTLQAPQFEFKKGNFLQEDMIEVGDFSAPAFADIDLDGDLDMIVGTYLEANTQRGSISLYQNIGTPSMPFFKWVSEDFAFLSYTSFFSIRPQFVDIDGNGSVDLAFTARSGGGGQTRLFYILSSTNSAPSFDPLNVQVLQVPLDLNANATIVDVDQDGLLDVLAGTSTGALNYFRNNGGNNFSLTSDAFLGLAASPSRQLVSVAVGDLDGDGRDDIISGDYRGNLSVYPDFRSAGSSPTPVTNLLYDSYSLQYLARKFGGSTRPVVANILGVNRPSVIVGNRQGGLSHLKNDNSQPLSDIPVVSISPNPLISGESLTIHSDRGVTIEIFTMKGTRVGKPQMIPGNQPTIYPVQGVASGLYVARFTAGSKSVALRFIVR